VPSVGLPEAGVAHDDDVSVLDGGVTAKKPFSAWTCASTMWRCSESVFSC